MRIPRIGFAFFVLVLAASILLMAGMLSRQEARRKIMEFQDRGTYLVSLMALHQIKDYQAGRRDLMMRTISENTSHEGFLYLFVQDQSGQAAPFLAPGISPSEIPPEVENAALYSSVATQQQFKTIGKGESVHEFAKSIYEGGKKVGTIRLGLRPPIATIISRDRIAFSRSWHSPSWPP